MNYSCSFYKREPSPGALVAATINIINITVIITSIITIFVQAAQLASTPCSRSGGQALRIQRLPPSCLRYYTHHAWYLWRLRRCSFSRSLKHTVIKMKSAPYPKSMPKVPHMKASGKSRLDVCMQKAVFVIPGGCMTLKFPLAFSSGTVLLGTGSCGLWSRGA